MSEIVICRFGSGVQKAMEQQEGPEFCDATCGTRKDLDALFRLEEARKCSEFATAWHADHDEEWKKGINERKKRSDLTIAPQQVLH